MTCGSKDIGGDGRDNFNDKVGLAGNHAYSLLGLFELIEGEGGYRCLTNPCG